MQKIPSKQIKGKSVEYTKTWSYRKMWTFKAINGYAQLKLGDIKKFRYICVYVNKYKCIFMNKGTH